MRTSKFHIATSTVIFYLAGLSQLQAQQSDTPTARADALYQQYEYAKAGDILVQQLSVHKDDAALLGLLAKVRIRQGEVEQAAECMEKVTALQPDQPEHFSELAGIYGACASKASILKKMGWAKKCAAALEKASALAPERLDLRKACFDYYQAAPSIVGGGKEKALAAAMEIEKRDTVIGGWLRCEVALKDKKFDEAFHIADELRAKHPDHAVGLYALGEVAIPAGRRLDEAEAALNAYLAAKPCGGLAPSYAQAHYQLGLLAAFRGDAAGAKLQYQEALKQDPRFQPALAELKKF